MHYNYCKHETLSDSMLNRRWGCRTIPTSTSSCPRALLGIIQSGLNKPDLNWTKPLCLRRGGFKACQVLHQSVLTLHLTLFTHCFHIHPPDNADFHTSCRWEAFVTFDYKKHFCFKLRTENENYYPVFLRCHPTGPQWLVLGRMDAKPS